MKGEEKQVVSAAEKVGTKVGKTVAEEYNEVMNKATEGSFSLHGLLGMDDVKIENVYAQGYRLYNTGKFKEAGQIFRYLMLISPGESRYLLGLAACCHMLKDYKAAVQVYLICGLLDPTSPIPDFHASDCYIAMNDKVSALICLNMAIEKAKERAEYQILKGRAHLTAETLAKELKLEETAVSKG